MPPRRYGPDGQRLWNGKLPEEFNESDIQQFLVDTNKQLNKTSKEDTAMSEEKLATAMEAENTAPPLKIDVTARPITPIKNLLGFASVKFNDAFVVEDFKIFKSEKGIFVGMPSKQDKSSSTGYRDTAKPITADFRKQLTEAVVTAYYAEVEKLQNRAAAVAPQEKQSIQKQLTESAKHAAKNNAARTAPAKGAKAKSAER